MANRRRWCCHRKTEDYARLKHAPRQRLSADLLRPGLLRDDEAALFDRQPDEDGHRDIAL